MLKNLLFVINKKYYKNLIFIFLGANIAAILEMLSLGSIPIFVGFIISPEVLLSKVPITSFRNLLNEFNYEKTILLISCVVLAAFIIKNLFLGLLIFFEHHTTFKIKKDISIKLFSYYVTAPYEFHLESNPASLNRNITYEITATVSSIIFLINLLREFLVIFVVVILLLLIDTKITILSFLALSFSVLVFFTLIKSFLKTKAKQSQRLRKKITQIINQSFGAIKDLKILLKEKKSIENFSKDIEILEKNTFYYQVVSKFPKIFLEIVSLIIMVLVVGVFLLLGRNFETMLPTLSLLAISMVRLIPAFNSISTSLSNLRINIPSINLLKEEMKNIDISKKDEIIRSKNFENNKIFSEDKSLLALENVTYTFPNSKIKSIRDISIKMEKGQSIGITGVTGAGKSTLFHLMLGLLKPQKGVIKFRGQDIQNNLTFLRNNVGYISQNVYLNDDTIKNNIIFGDDKDKIDDKNLLEAIEISGLKSFLSKLENGLETKVGSDGLRLSGGERQRIGIARAIYKKPELLFMDESTSSLDYKTEDLIVSNLKIFSKDRTIVIIAHRLSTIKHCDKIHLLKDGKVIDSGNFQEIQKRNQIDN